VSARSIGEGSKATNESCHPQPTPGAPQYIIGYGSLINSESKGTTSQETGPNIPVNVTGLARHWNAQGTSITASTTYLGILRDEKSHINAVIYALTGSEPLNAIKSYDKRERFYCRIEIPRSRITILPREEQLESKLEDDAQFWIYENIPEFTKSPNDKYPIVQSYVDIFISGCMEQEEKFGLKGFAETCVESTKGWNLHWVNDRLTPRRPSKYQPMAYKIDFLLNSKLPEEFKHIKIE